jgi:hypothetical protein
MWPRTRMWLHFVSYKFGRLLLPWMIVGMALSTFWLPQPWREIALSGQIGFYGLAAVNHWMPKSLGPLKKLSAVSSAFVVLVGAALCASAVLIVPPERLWRTR